MRPPPGYLLVVCIATACAQSAPAPVSQADADAIRAVSDAYTDAVRDTAWTKWASFFTDDALILPPNTPAQAGRAVIERWGRTLPRFKDLRFEPIEIQGCGDLALVRGHYSAVVTLPNQPEQAHSGNYIQMWRRQRDGSWKLHRDIWNSDQPRPATPSPRTRSD